MQWAVSFPGHHKVKTLLVRSRMEYCGSRGIAPLILTRWKWEVRFIPQPLDPMERTCCTYGLRVWV